MLTNYVRYYIDVIPYNPMTLISINILLVFIYWHLLTCIYIPVSIHLYLYILASTHLHLLTSIYPLHLLTSILSLLLPAAVARIINNIFVTYVFRHKVKALPSFPLLGKVVRCPLPRRKAKWLIFTICLQKRSNVILPYS